VTEDELVAAAIDVAGEGLAAGELPIGAVAALGDDVVGRAFTQERGLGRRLVHADLLAMTQADERGDVPPAVRGGILRRESRELFRRYATAFPDSPEGRWARTMAELP
jgi:hypothetical protein